MKDWYTLAEASEFAGLGNTTIRSKIKSGDLQAVKRPSKHGPRWEISGEALQAFVSDQPYLEGGDLGGLQGVTITPKVSDASERSDTSEGSNPSEVSEASDWVEDSDPSTPSVGSPRTSDTMGIIQQALKVAEQAREDRIDAMDQRDYLVEENDRLRRQLCEVHVLLGSERRLLAENSESLIQKEAHLKEAQALKEQQAAEARKIREEAEAQTHKAQAEAKEAQAKLELAESKIKDAEAKVASFEENQKKSFWKRLFS